jgi:transcriptional regulator with XRE-family HTH domain
MPRAPSDPKTLEAVSAYLAELFRDGSLTQEELAARVGVSQPTISDAKNGRKATDETVAKLAVAMGVSAEDILSGAATEALRSRPRERQVPTRTYEKEDRYPARAAAEKAIRKSPNVNEDALEMMLSDNSYETPMGPKDWIKVYYAYVDATEDLAAGRRPRFEGDPDETEAAEAAALETARRARAAPGKLEGDGSPPGVRGIEQGHEPTKQPAKSEAPTSSTVQPRAPSTDRVAAAVGKGGPDETRVGRSGSPKIRRAK